MTDGAPLYVTRTVRMPLGLAEVAANGLRWGSDPVRGLLLPTGGRVELQLPVQVDEWHPARRGELVPLRTGGRLFTRSNRKVCALEIELSPWTNDVTEVALRPAERSRYGWSGRRLRHWFTHAHAAADTLHAALLQPAPGLIDLTDAEREHEAVAV